MLNIQTKPFFTVAEIRKAIKKAKEIIVFTCITGNIRRSVSLTKKQALTLYVDFPPEEKIDSHYFWITENNMVEIN